MNELKERRQRSHVDKLHKAGLLSRTGLLLVRLH